MLKPNSAIQVAEFRQLELTNLPNLIYGFTDEQLALAVSSVPTVTPPVVLPVAPPVTTPVTTPVMTPVGKPSETLIDAVQMRRLDRVREKMLTKVASMLPARYFMTGHRYKGRPFSYFAFLEKAVRPTNMARQLVVTRVLPYSEL